VVIDAYCKLESNAIALFSGAKTRISYRKWYSKFIYTHVFNYSKNTKTRMGLAIENRLLLLTPILPSDKITPVQPKIYLTEREIEEARTYLEQGGINFETPLIMMGILGSSEDKTYPLPYMARLIDEIAKNREVTLLFNYIPSQQEEADRLYSLCTEETRKSIKFDLFASSLRTFLAMLYFCDALISNEGGAVNMAKAMNLPTFSIFSPWVSKEAWDTYKSEQDLTVHLKDYKPEKIQGKLKGELKNSARELYQLFEPTLFRGKLRAFLNQIPAG
jgi:heptosyltransferase-2